MKNKTVIVVIALAVLIFGAKFGYDKLKTSEAINQSTTPQVEADKSEMDKTDEEKNDVSTDASNNGGEKDKKDEKADAKSTKAPNFTVRDIDGNKVEFASFVGKPVVINFWATWCKYCRQEMPDLQEVYNEYKSQGVEFLLINATDNQGETRENVMAYLKENNITMPVYFDEGIIGVDGLTVEDSAQAVYGVPSYPSTVFVDKDGNIAGAKIGLITKEELVKALDQLVK